MNDEDLTGRTLGDFHILSRLGQGGMGAVFLAEQISLKRKVALKMLRPELAADPASLKRFRAEAETVARITHANIVQVYAIGDYKDRPFMAMEYVEGQTLRAIVARRGSPNLPICLAIMRQVAAALQRAGEAGLVHRDIKPENILVTRHVEVKVADFGLSRLLDQGRELHLTQTGMTMGTPLYMSPEQVRNRPLDPRSDIYSFGVTCYYMLAGQPPFHGNTAMEVALKHCEETPPPLSGLQPNLPEELCRLVHAMMEKDPARRPQSGREVLRELARIERAPATEALILQTLATQAIDGAADRIDPIAATEPLPAARRRVPAVLLVAGSLLAAAALGAGAKLLRDHMVTAPSAIDDRPNLEIISNAERLLLLAVEENANPKPEKLREGMAFHLRLGALFWDQRRFDDAARFFANLQQRGNAMPQYALIGYLGMAITLALRDDAESSTRAVRMFGELSTRYPQYRMVLTPPLLPAEDLAILKYWLTTALDRLAANAGPLPRGLDRLREDARNRRPPFSPAGKG